VRTKLLFLILHCFKISPGVIQIELISSRVSEHFFCFPPGYKNLFFLNWGECFSNCELFFTGVSTGDDLTGVLIQGCI